MVDISELPDLSTATPEYVEGLVEERYSDLARLPPQAREILRSCRGRILDVGPGEGVSSMALARFAEKATVLGVEMDQKHLAVAWPLCRGYRNLQLKWAVFGNPSNRRIVNDGPLAPSASIIECSCTHLFSWLGMSRGLIFAPDSESDWSGVVSEACVLVYPAFWRRGTDWLPGSARSTIGALCGRLGLTPPTWAGSGRVPGFAKSSFYELGRQTKASGWLLWLSGIFDSSSVSLWDTLSDRWSENPQYQLAQVRFELEVAVAWR